MMCNLDVPERRQPSIDSGDDSSLTSMAIELMKTPSEELCRLMAKEFLCRRGGGTLLCEGDRTGCH